MRIDVRVIAASNRNLEQMVAAGKSSKAATKVRKFYEAMDETAREVCIEAFAAAKGNCLGAAQLWDFIDIPPIA
jgi:hypothetical protein